MGDRVIWGGRYAIYDELASGGMATVFLAGRIGEDADVPPVVALKKLSAQFAKQPEFVAMFLDEAHLAARIRHPNVVATYEFLRTDEGLGIVMDLVVGSSLMELVRGANTSMQAPPPLPVALAIITGALDGLQAAHAVSDDRGKSLNLVHRDISPHNILVGLDGVARVIDFGIAKAAGRLQVTDVGVLKGKFAYMSPEQIHGKTVDRRTDVYAAGVVLWEALVGRKLFRASSNEELLNQRSSKEADIPPPSVVNRAVPPALDAIVRQALAPDPSERFGSALMMAETIRAELEVADPQTVADWVKSRAGDKLERLAARRRSIEAEMAGGPEPSAPRDSLPGLPPVKDRSSRHSQPGAQAPLRVPSLEPPEPKPPRKPASSVTSNVSTLRSPTDRFAGDLSLDDPGEHPDGHIEIDLAPGEIVAPRRPSLAHEPAPRPWPRHPRPEARPLRGTGFLVLVVLLLAVSGVLFVAGPGLLKGRVIAAASTGGVMLSVERVSLAHGGLHLAGVSATLKGCPGLRLTAPDASLQLDRTGTVETISLPAFELNVDGTVSDIATQLRAWRKDRQGGPMVEGFRGRVRWSGVIAPAVTIEAQGTTVSVTATTDATLTVDTSNVLVNLPRGHVGPWRLRLESGTNETRARFSLDPTVPDAPPTATFMQRKTEGATWAVDVPRASSIKIGIPSEVLGAANDVAVEAALQVRVNAEGNALTGEGQLGLYGWPVSTGRAASVPADLLVSGSLAGDPAKPLTIIGGKVSIGKSSGPVAGTVQLGDSIRIDLERVATKGVPLLVIDTDDWVKGPRVGK